MRIGGHSAVIQYDPEIGMFRGEFADLNGGADFYADSVPALRREGEISLKTFLAVREEKGIKPWRSFSGRFNVHMPKDIHAEAATIAKARGVRPKTACKPLI
ncbi:MAG TPA: type II toxin-antitoxin system HicB family antitoxin [Acidiphilium sp.]